jgi:hypothetical protein
MNEMQHRYGAKKGKSVFYATANKRDQMPSAGIPEATPELGPRTRNRGDGPARLPNEPDEQDTSAPGGAYPGGSKPKPTEPGIYTAHVYEERAKPRPGQPPFGPMTPGGKGVASHLKGSGKTDAYGWARGLMPNNAKICKGM